MTPVGGARLRDDERWRPERRGVEGRGERCVRREKGSGVGTRLVSAEGCVERVDGTQSEARRALGRRLSRVACLTAVTACPTPRRTPTARLCRTTGRRPRGGYGTAPDGSPTPSASGHRQVTRRGRAGRPMSPARPPDRPAGAVPISRPRRSQRRAADKLGNCRRAATYRTPLELATAASVTGSTSGAPYCGM